MQRIVPVILACCACALGGALAASAESPADPSATTEDSSTTVQSEPTQGEVQKLVDPYRLRTWTWQRVMGERLTLALPHPPQDALAKVAAWKRFAARTQARALHPPHANAWTCIHRYEGAWTDAGPLYYGGLQMDLGFQRTYGGWLLARKGTANRWTPLEQMWVAERAVQAGRGFWPWPNTARFCGLL